MHLVLGEGVRFTGPVDLSARAITFLGRAAGVSGDDPPVADKAGASLGAGHDVNGDGLDDFIVGAPGDHLGDVTGGRAYLVFGREG